VRSVTQFGGELAALQFSLLLEFVNKFLLVLRVTW